MSWNALRGPTEPTPELPGAVPAKVCGQLEVGRDVDATGEGVGHAEVVGDRGDVVDAEDETGVTGE